MTGRDQLVSDIAEKGFSEFLKSTGGDPKDSKLYDDYVEKCAKLADALERKRKDDWWSMS